MTSQFYIVKQNREVFIKLVESLTIDQLNEIPIGYNNNIAWNFAHIVVSQQLLCYAKAGKEIKIEKDYIEKYQRGTRPNGYIGKDEINFFKEKAISLINELQRDWESGFFKEYQSFTTSMGINIHSCDEALHFAAGHDQLHFGYCQALKRFVLNNSLLNNNFQLLNK